MPPMLRRSDREICQKGPVGPTLYAQMSPSRPLSEATEMDDTEFEDDLSDVEEYSGRRSEESVSRTGFVTSLNRV